MRVVISESQLKKIISEQTPAFYRKNGDLYSFNQGGPLGKRQGDINASDLFKDGVPKGGYPQKLSTKQVTDLLSKPVFNASSSNINFQNVIQGKPAFSPPSDWESEEEKYSVFNEPLGKIDQSVSGNYRGHRGLIPPQTNKYFWDSDLTGTTKQQMMNSQGRTTEKSLQTRGGWVIKSINNVNKWRNVPAGYHPSEYSEAIKWETTPKYNRNLSKDAESTRIQLPQTKYKNPYFHPEAPLGLTQSQAEQVKVKRGEVFDKFKYDIKAPRGADTIWEITKGNREAIRQQLFSEQQKALEEINNSYGIIKQEIEQEKDEIPMWFKVIQYSLYLIPYTAPYASEINGLVELALAAKHLEDGKPGKAAAEAFFGILPFTGLKAVLQNANVLNGLKHLAEKRALTKAEEVALKELSKMPAYHPAKVVSDINMGMEKIINTVLPQTWQTGAIKVSKNFSKKVVSDLEKQVGAYGALKYASNFLY